MTNPLQTGPTAVDAIRSLAPGAQFAVVGDLSAGGEIIWHSPDIEQPSAEQIEIALGGLQVQAQLKTYRKAVQTHIDTIAQSRNYDNGVSAASYVGDPNAAWAAEAAAFVAWRSAVWAGVFTLLEQVQAGEAPMPESPAALIAALPQIEWP
jgi:hypothetical protein